MNAVAISYNWNTQEIHYTPFEGPTAGVQALDFVRPSSFVWRDFPESEGWTHFFQCDQEAAEAKGEILTQRMFGV